VIEQVLRMANPKNDGGLYSLIADLYVIGGKFEEAERLKKLMLNEHVRQAKGLNLDKNGSSDCSEQWQKWVGSFSCPMAEATTTSFW
jgi:hypothetical protein